MTLRGIQDETDELKRQKYSEIIISETERMYRQWEFYDYH